MSGSVAGRVIGRKLGLGESVREGGGRKRSKKKQSGNLEAGELRARDGTQEVSGALSLVRKR